VDGRSAGNPAVNYLLTFENYRFFEKNRNNPFDFSADAW